MSTKIVMFHPNPFSATRPYRGVPLGSLGAVRMLAYDPNYEIKVIHPVSHKHFDQDVLMECKNAMVLGISAITGHQIKEGLDVATKVRRYFPNVKIVWGGWHPSIMPEQTLENENVDIIGHPTGRIIDQREPYEVDMQAVLKAAARTNTALEINSYPSRLDLSDVNARAAKEMGVKISINSDAHDAEQLLTMKYGVNVARRAWLEKKDVLNALSLKELLSVLKR